MQNKEFKKGDTVYIGTLEGKVDDVKGDSNYPIKVLFGDEPQYFTIEGAYIKNSPSILKHFPYEIEYKEVEIVPEIEKDTLVYYQLGSYHWDIGYYSHYDKENKKHYVIVNQKKSFETFISFSVNNISLTNPLI